jgi:hypothetical protein
LRGFECNDGSKRVEVWRELIRIRIFGLAGGKR